MSADQNVFEEILENSLKMNNTFIKISKIVYAECLWGEGGLLKLSEIMTLFIGENFTPPLPRAWRGLDLLLYKWYQKGYN